MGISFNVLAVLLVIISIITSTLVWIALSDYGIVVPTSKGNKLEQEQGGSMKVKFIISPNNQSSLLNKSLNKSG